MKPKIYLAGPISGLTYEQATTWRAWVAEQLDEAVECMSPMRGKAWLKNSVKTLATFVKLSPGNTHDAALVTPRAIVTRDLQDVRLANLLLVNFTIGNSGPSLILPRVSVGTVYEIAVAKEHNIPIVLVMKSGDVHYHPFITEAAGFVVEDLETAIQVVRSVLNLPTEVSANG